MSSPSSSEVDITSTPDTAQASQGSKLNGMRVIKFAGAFAAFIIGSGYATGQEMLQFFTTYGIYSFGGIAIALVLFAWAGKVLMNFGWRHRDLDAEALAERGFTYFAGKYFGLALSWFIPFFLFLVVVIMLAGSGATLAQAFGIPTWAGALAMGLAIYVVNIFGFNKVVDVVGAIGPVIIVFTIGIAIYALAINPEGLSHMAQNAPVLASLPNATDGNLSLWALAGLLYVAYNITGSVPFLTSTGALAENAREAKLGGILGGVALLSAALLINMALLAYAPQIAELAAPNVFFATLIHPVVGNLFVVIILCGIFSTAAPMLWTSTTRLVSEDNRYYKLALTGLTIAAIIVGFLPYGELMSFIYPKMGYLGIIFLVLIVIRQVIELINKRSGKDIEAPAIKK